MTMAELGMHDLSESQQLALTMYTSVTAQDPSEAIPLLQRSEWNVQIAIAKFFDGEGPDLIAEAQRSQTTSPPPAQRRTAATLFNDPTSYSRASPAPRREPAPRIIPQPESQTAWQPPMLIAILLSPFNLLTRLVGRTFSLVGYIFSLLPRLFSQGSAGRLPSGRQPSRRPLNAKDTAARFMREFEEAYGQTELRFFQGGYAQAYDLAKKELKFLLVVLISPEHDDTSAFVRETLLSPNVISYINDPQSQVILWAGSVQDSEAYQVSTALNCSKFPFAALVVHTPQDSSTSMSTIARISGLEPPSVFISRLRSAITQHTPNLQTVRNTRNEQQASRNLREEQNSAYERSLAQDRERARQRREAEAAQARAEQETRDKAAAAERHAQQLAQWRRWRAQSIPSEPGPEAKNATRISVRMLSGERIIRKFTEHTDLEQLYALVECYDILQSGASPHVSEPQGYEHQYSFRLVSPMPRIVYDFAAGGTIGEKIGRSGNLIVEPIDDEDD